MRHIAVWVVNFRRWSILILASSGVKVIKTRKYGESSFIGFYQWNEVNLLVNSCDGTLNNNGIGFGRESCAFRHFWMFSCRYLLLWVYFDSLQPFNIFHHILFLSESIVSSAMLSVCVFACARHSRLQLSVLLFAICIFAFPVTSTEYSLLCLFLVFSLW